MGRMLFTGWMCFIILFVLDPESVGGYVLNSDRQYQRWPNGKVSFYIPPGQYSQTELSIIGQAMTKFNQDMGGCIRFEQLTQPPIGNFLNYVEMSRAGGTGTPSPTCFSYPGNVAIQNGQGQAMSIQGGQNGCLANFRQVMRLIASLVGLRSEHNKSTRDNFVQMIQQNVNQQVQPYAPFGIYNSNTVITDPNDFDYNSITLIDPTTFSGNGGPVIQPRFRQIFNSGALSMKDCQAIAFYYQCNVNCQDPYGAGGIVNQQLLQSQLNQQFTNQPFNPLFPNQPLNQPFINQPFQNPQFPNQPFNPQFPNQPINQPLINQPIQNPQFPNQPFPNQPFQQPLPNNQPFQPFPNNVPLG